MNNICQFCGEIRPTLQGLCESCKEEYTTVKTYIETHPQPNVMQIANGTQIPINKIRLFVQKGHFVVSNVK